MARRHLRLFLLALIAIGGLVAILEGIFYRSLRTEKLRLTNMVRAIPSGHFIIPIEDSSKIYVMRIPTKDALKIAWRVYLPAKYSDKWRARTNSKTAQIQSNPHATLAREVMVSITFRIVANREVDAFCDCGRGTIRFQMQVPNDLPMNSEELLQLACNGAILNYYSTKIYDPSESAILLDARWTSEHVEKNSSLSQSAIESLLNSPIAEFGFGTDQAWQARDESDSHQKHE